MEFIEIEILNWYKYNKRRDFKSPRWFALSNRILEDSEMFGLSGDEFKAWIYILCQASQNNSAMVRINVEHARRVSGISKKCLLSVISIFEKLQSIRTYERESNVTLHNNTLHNNTKYIAHPNGFAEFWSGYPRKVGKGKAKKAYDREINLGTDPSELIAARDKYREYIKSKNTEEKFIKHCSTFMSEWRDWLDPEAGQSESFAQKENSLDDLKLDGGAA